MTFNYTVREPLICDYIASFDSEVELDYQAAIDHANELTADGQLDWEPEYDAREINRAYVVSQRVDNQPGVVDMVAPSEQALVDAGIKPYEVARYIASALGENLMDEVRGLLEADVVPGLDELEEKGVNARELILEYVRDAIIIDFVK